MKVQTVVPLWAERHQGGGVAPECKALAEEAWGGGTSASPDPTPTRQDAWGMPSSAPWVCSGGGGVPSL